MDSLKKTGYYLLNKDEIIASFYVSDIVQTAIVIEQCKEVPKYFDIHELLYRKRVKRGRENLNEFLNAMQIKTLCDFLDISHALSLTDTFWVKQIDSNLTWSDVSLYSHDFNPVIADIALNGNIKLNNWSSFNYGNFSPEPTTDGSFAKCWIREVLAEEFAPCVMSSHLKNMVLYLMLPLTPQMALILTQLWVLQKSIKLSVKSKQ